MEVILREDIEKLGHRGEVVKVAAGLRAQFPAAEAAGSGGNRIEQEDRRAGARRASAPGSQAAVRGRGSGPSCCPPSRVTITQRPAKKVTSSVR